MEAAAGGEVLGHYDGEKLILEEVNRFPDFFCGDQWNLLLGYFHDASEFKGNP